MSVTIRAFALAVLASALIVSGGFSAESTVDRADERRPLVAPTQMNADGDLLVDMVAFVGSSPGAFSYRTDREERQQEGIVEPGSLQPAIRTHADRIRLLQVDSTLPVLAPEPRAVSDQFEFREDHTAFWNVRDQTAISGGELQFTEENTILPIRGESAHLTTEQVMFLEENLILASGEANASIGDSLLLPFAQTRGVDH